MNKKIEILCGDSRELLKKYPDNYFSLIITSPPYADARKKHYLSVTPNEYSDFFKSFHSEFWRVLKDDGSFILNIKDKVVNGVRHRYVWNTVQMLSDLGWLCVDDYIWYKTNAMPGFWHNRLRDEWEYCFHFTKNAKFKMNQHSVKKPIGDWAGTRLKKLKGKSAVRHNSENESGFGRDLNAWVDKPTVLPGNVIQIPLVGVNKGHPAVFPIGLPEFFIKLFTDKDDFVLDPFAGSGTTGEAALNNNRNVVLMDLEENYFEIMRNKFRTIQLQFPLNS